MPRQKLTWRNTSALCKQPATFGDAATAGLPAGPATGAAPASRAGASQSRAKYFKRRRDASDEEDEEDDDDEREGRGDQETGVPRSLSTRLDGKMPVQYCREGFDASGSDGGDSE